MKSADKLSPIAFDGKHAGGVIQLLADVFAVRVSAQEHGE